MKGDTLILSQINVMITQEVNDMGKLKTSLLQSPAESLATTASLEFQDELVADEDMKIVAVSFHAIHTQEGNNYGTLQRSGQPRMLNRYHTGFQSVQGDDIIAGTRITMDGDPAPSTASKGTEYYPFPAGHYFEVEEGERIYFTGRLQNDDANTHTMLMQCVVYWY